MSSVVQSANYPPRLRTVSVIAVSVAKPPPNRWAWIECTFLSSFRIGGRLLAVPSPGGVFCTDGALTGNPVPSGGSLRSSPVPGGGALRRGPSQHEAVVFGGGALAADPPASTCQLQLFPKTAHSSCATQRLRKEMRCCFFLPVPALLERLVQLTGSALTLELHHQYSLMLQV